VGVLVLERNVDLLRVFVWNDTDNWLTLGTEISVQTPESLESLGAVLLPFF
jgi:hypothetical protein